MDTPTYISFQNARVFSWTCPKCVADEMPFHDCSVLSSSSSDTSRSDNSQSQCIDLPSLISPARLRLANINCRSLLSVADEVFDLFMKQSIDVFAITETWLDSSIADNEIFPYTSSIIIVHSDRNRHGGGVAFFSIIKSEVCGKIWPM